MKTLVFTNRKGGVGKTTLAIHAAWYFMDSKRVLFIETDTQRNASTSLSNYVSDVPVSRLMQGSVTLAGLTEPGLTVLQADNEVNNLAGRGDEPLTTFISNIKNAGELYDICIIDTAPSTSYLNVGALIVASHVVAPLNMSQYSLDGIQELLKQIVGVQQKYNSNLNFLGLLPNAFIATQPSQKEALNSLLKAFGEKYMFGGYLSNRQAFSDAAAEKKPVWQIPKSAAREAGKEIKAVLTIIENKMFPQEI